MDRTDVLILSLKLSLPRVDTLLYEAIFGILALLPMGWLFVGQPKVEVVIEPDYCLEKVDVVEGHHEIDHSARCTTAETLVPVVVGL